MMWFHLSFRAYIDISAPIMVEKCQNLRNEIKTRWGDWDSNLTFGVTWKDRWMICRRPNESRVQRGNGEYVTMDS